MFRVQEIKNPSIVSSPIINQVTYLRFPNTFIDLFLEIIFPRYRIVLTTRHLMWLIYWHKHIKYYVVYSNINNNEVSISFSLIFLGKYVLFKYGSRRYSPRSIDNNSSCCNVYKCNLLSYVTNEWNRHSNSNSNLILSWTQTCKIHLL